MTGLFARLYLDEDVSARAADLLLARGFNVLSTLQAKRLAAPDQKQLEFAAAEGRALVTHNRRDFEQLVKEYFDSGTTHAGVIIAVRRPPRELAERILAILNLRTADEIFNQTIYV